MKIYGHPMSTCARKVFTVMAEKGQDYEFVLVDLMKGEQKKLYLGNLDAKRDWGHARDYVRAMHLMLAHPEPHDLVVGTGRSHSVRDFLDAAFAVVDMDWEEYVEIDPRFYRPAEVDFLQADISKATATIGWTPETTFEELVTEMVQADLMASGVSV